MRTNLLHPSHSTGFLGGGKNGGNRGGSLDPPESGRLSSLVGLIPPEAGWWIGPLRLRSPGALKGWNRSRSPSSDCNDIALADSLELDSSL